MTPDRERDTIRVMKRIIAAVNICLLAGLIAGGNIPTAECASQKTVKGESQRQSKIPSKFLARRSKDYDNSLAVSVESVLQNLKEKQQVTLIDVRNEKEYEEIRIPGSVNIPLFAIQTKAFLKTSNLILLNEGYSYSSLEQECKRLRNSGFTSVAILNGGLTYWKEKGGVLEGNVFKQKELNKVPPGKFFAERNYKNWILIDVSETRETKTNHLLPQGVHIPYTNNSEEFVAKIKTAMGQPKQDSFLPVLILNKNGQDYEEIERLLRNAGTRTTFFLKGGLDGYKTFLQKQALIRRSKANQGKTSQKCSACQ